MYRGLMCRYTSVLLYWLMKTATQYISYYSSPLGEILLSADEAGLTGLWFVEQKHFAPFLKGDEQVADLPVFADTKRWLDAYFCGDKPESIPQLHPIGTDFQRAVWRTLLTIPYGATMTYGQIAEKLAAERDVPKMSARAVGGAVGRNHISLIIPCHRVIGADGNLTGYAGGVERKIKLLQLEGLPIGDNGLQA